MDIKNVINKAVAVFLRITVLSEILKVMTIYQTKKTATNNRVLIINNQEKKDEQ